MLSLRRTLSFVVLGSFMAYAGNPLWALPLFDKSSGDSCLAPVSGFQHIRKMKEVAATIEYSLSQDIYLSEEDTALMEALGAADHLHDILRTPEQYSYEAGVLYDHLFWPHMQALKRVRDILEGETFDRQEWETILGWICQKRPKGHVHIPGEPEAGAIEIAISPEQIKKYVEAMVHLFQTNPSLKNMIDSSIPHVLPFREISVSHMQLPSLKLYNHWILSQPEKHLRLCVPGAEVGERFRTLRGETVGLLYNVAWLKDPQGHSQEILAVSEIGWEKNILRTWALMDEDGALIPLKHGKKSTLPFPMVSNEETYEQKAQFTYTFMPQVTGVPLLPDRFQVVSVGFDWIHIPQLPQRGSGIIPTLLARAKISHGRGEIVAAIEAYQKVLRLERNNIKALRGLAKVCLDSQKPELAEQGLHAAGAALEQQSDRAENRVILLDIASFFALQGQLEKAKLAEQLAAHPPTTQAERENYVKALGLGERFKFYNLLGRSEIQHIVQGLTRLGLSVKTQQLLEEKLKEIKGITWWDFHTSRISVDTVGMAFLAELYRLIGEKGKYRLLAEEGVTHEYAEFYAAKLLDINSSLFRYLLDTPSKNQHAFLAALRFADPSFLPRFAREFTGGDEEQVEAQEVLAKYIQWRILGPEACLARMDFFSPAIENAIAISSPEIREIVEKSSRVQRRQALLAKLGPLEKTLHDRSPARTGNYGALMSLVHKELKENRFEKIDMQKWLPGEARLESVPGEPRCDLVMNSLSGRATNLVLRWHQGMLSRNILCLDLERTPIPDKEVQNVHPPKNTDLHLKVRWFQPNQVPVKSPEVLEALLAATWEKLLAHYADVASPYNGSVELRTKNPRIMNSFRRYFGLPKGKNKISAAALFRMAKERGLSMEGFPVWDIMSKEEMGPNFFQYARATAKDEWLQYHDTSYWSARTAMRIQSFVDKLVAPLYGGQRLRVLDLMTGEYSFVPQGIPTHLAIVGRNAEELMRNPLAKTTLPPQDLTAQPALPLEASSQDAVTIISGVQYLDNPVEILKEVRRILKPGSPVAIIGAVNAGASSSEIKGWGAVQSRDIQRVIGRYLRDAGFQNTQWFEEIVDEPSVFPFQMYFVWAYKPSAFSGSQADRLNEAVQGYADASL